ncbi:MAG: protein kinase [Myxococcales bacterium]|nr:protein kinase [Myxococcales bacterium]
MSNNLPSTRPNPKGGSIVAGRYQVDKLIARGGMATVYLAHQVGLNRPVALKILTPPPESEDAAAFEHRFRLEAETLAQLDHPNIVILHDFGETEDRRFYLAMEFIDGQRLSDMLKDGPMQVDLALRLLLQVCAGLRYAHKRGVVHRDLKPSNLLVRKLDDGDFQVKLVDFGLVKLTSDDQSITRAGLILGSPHCMAPEQVRGLEVDHRADIYAIGVLLFRILTGHYPFHGPNSAATMIAHLNQSVPTFYSVAPDIIVPEGLEEVVRRCLSKNPNERFSNVREVMEALGACMQVAPDTFRSFSQANSTLGHHSAISVAPRTQRPSRVPLAMMGIGVGVALIVATLLLGAVVGLMSLGTEGMPTAQSISLPQPTAAVQAVAAQPIEALPTAGEAEEVQQAEEPPTEVVQTPPPAPVVAEPKPTVRSAPRQTRRRTPAAPVTPKPKPRAEAQADQALGSPDPQPKPKTEDKTTAPEGYMGMPDDLIE